MKYCFAALLPLLLLLSVFSCKPDDELLTRDPGARLEFSTDTIFFDTVFVSTGSVTKRLKVYNRNNKAVKIEEIRLEQLGASKYDLIIDGVTSDVAHDITLRGNDSLLVLVRVFINPNSSATPFFIEDKILFRTNGNNQQVALTAYGRNANFYRDVEICNEIWEGPNAYVLYGEVVVKEGCTLTIRPGTQIYSHAGSGLFVLGTLKVEGTASRKVFFQNDRIDSTFNIPGQWLGIFVLGDKSVNNHIQYAEVKNALFGLNINNRNNNETLIENTVIRNIFSIGILNVSSDIKVVNTLVTNCGTHAIAGVGGGNTNINYCTIANYTPDFKRDTDAMAFSDTVIFNDGTGIVKQTRVTMSNSIVWNGTRNGRNEELLFRSGGPVASTFTNNLLQTTRYANHPRVNCCGNILNQDPKFVQPGDNSVATRKVNYRLKPGSPAIGAAIDNGVTIDLTGGSRPQGGTTPDMGAYESPE